MILNVASRARKSSDDSGRYGGFEARAYGEEIVRVVALDALLDRNILYFDNEAYMDEVREVLGRFEGEVSGAS